MLAEPCGAFFDESGMLHGIDEFQRHDGGGGGEGAGAQFALPVALFVPQAQKMSLGAGDGAIEFGEHRGEKRVEAGLGQFQLRT